MAAATNDVQKKKTITGLGPVHTDRDIFETDAVSVSGFTGFVKKADSFRKYVVSKISGLEWS